MAKTLKIRIPCAVDPKGRWLAYGWTTIKSHDEMLDSFDSDTIGPYEKLYWITVELPIPEVTEIIGTAIPGPKPSP